MKAPYQPEQTPDGKWSYATATGRRVGFPDRWSAIKAAANDERADRYEAANGTGAVATAMRGFFTNHEKQTPSRLAPTEG